MKQENRRIVLTPKRGIAGCVLAAAALISSAVAGNIVAGIPFAVLLVLAGFFRFQPKNGVIATVVTMAFCTVMMLVAPFYPNLMLAPEKFGIILPEVLMLNGFFAMAVWGFFGSVTGRWKGAYAVSSLVMLIVAFINTYVFRFRGNEVSPADIFYIQTAINVAGNYNFTVTEKMLVAAMIWATSAFALGSLPAIPRGKPRRAMRAVTLVFSVALGVTYALGTNLVPYHTWSCEGTLRSGFFVNFSVGIRRTMVQEPEGYSVAEVDALAQQASQSENSPAENTKKPHIIVVMNESFADFATLNGEMPATNQPVTPFYDSLTENCIKGHALTSVFGGTTANAEFELLTGCSMAFLPKGSCPYQQFIRGEMPGLVSTLKAQGYDCVSTHPYDASGWNRTKVYPLLGFDKSTFDEVYKKAEEVRAYVSDKAVYMYIMQHLVSAGSNPQFVFAITMQNHGGYDYTGENLVTDVTLEGHDRDFPDADQYFSLMRESDRALEHLIGMLERYEEDVLLLFFGDHYPALDNACYDALRGGEATTLEMRMGSYTVPYLIWANYDIEEADGGLTSLNYLGTMLTRAAGLELTPYQQFQEQVQTCIPALNPMGYYSPSAGGFVELEDAQGEEKQWLDNYEMVQYNHLFDTGNRSREMFGTEE